MFIRINTRRVIIVGTTILVLCSIWDIETFDSKILLHIIYECFNCVVYLWYDDAVLSNTTTHSMHTRTRTDVNIFFSLKRKLKLLALFGFLFLFAYGKDLCNSLPIVMICVMKTNILFFSFISFYCTTSLITDYKYT